MIQISLAAARVNAGYKQDEAAVKIGVTPKTLRGYEQNKVIIPSTTLRKAAKLYGIPSDMIRLPVIEDGEYDENFLNSSTV
ncbi:helix-turn-helix domain-containing protein [Lentibacillus salicampi]|uniref:XRE family transcriptional regulator n=1 Tax=Lentibacillus salicampi TaxID=175306 RepID=A0A4Y9A8L6_9BACI|nr:helix-turn-helix transcriptional regulator [Lentibacillus salicampi]TFJ92176.1 XRE family transcriptional regulator [Lentibacillus salicampi]